VFETCAQVKFETCAQVKFKTCAQVKFETCAQVKFETSAQVKFETSAYVKFEACAQVKFEGYLKDRLCKCILTEEIIVMEYVLLFYGNNIVQIFKYLINVNYCIKIIGTVFYSKFEFGFVFRFGIWRN
jgi:hypothetical protein